jgi:hypothetical protein
MSALALAVEKLAISEKLHKFEDRKCLDDPCKSLVGILTRSNFRDFGEVSFSTATPVIAN